MILLTIFLILSKLISFFLEETKKLIDKGLLKKL